MICALINTGIDLVQWSLLLGLGVVKLSAAGLGVRIGVALSSLVSYIPVMFVLEEVFFRGALDAWVHPIAKDAPAKPGWESALAVSAVWGLWHLSHAGEISLSGVMLLLAVHCPFGMVLSYYWRRTGNLLVPGFSHALSDSIRNALVFAG